MEKETKYILGIIAAIAIVFLYMKNKGKISAALITEEDIPLPAPPPPPQSLPSSNVVSNEPPISSNVEPARTAIENYVISLYNSKVDRESILNANNTREGLFNGLSYKSGVRTVLTQALPSGNPDQFPIIPTKVNSAYAQRLDVVQDIPTIETFENNGQFDTGMSLYKTALDFSDVGGANLWPNNIAELMAAGLFFVSGSKDTNMSERYDSYCRDMAILCRNAADACVSANSHFEARAIADLNATGWNII